MSLRVTIVDNITYDHLVGHFAISVLLRTTTSHNINLLKGCQPLATFFKSYLDISIFTFSNVLSVQRLTPTINMLLNSLLKIASAVVVNTIIVPIFIAFFVPVAIGYYVLQGYFLATSR